MRTVNDDARIFFGIGEYGTSSNTRRGDVLFEKDCRELYGAEAWSACCNEVSRAAMAAAGFRIPEPTPDPMTKVVQALQKNRSLQRSAWLKVTEAARKYAQMKAHGSYINCGNSITVSDRENMTKMYADEVLRTIERAYAEDALMGAALADAT